MPSTQGVLPSSSNIDVRRSQNTQTTVDNVPVSWKQWLLLIVISQWLIDRWSTSCQTQMIRSPHSFHPGSRKRHIKTVHDATRKIYLAVQGEFRIQWLRNLVLAVCRVHHTITLVCWMMLINLNYKGRNI